MESTKSRVSQLNEINKYIEDVDKEVTMLLQSLQWDLNHLSQSPTLVTCKYDANHKMPADKKEQHEMKCYLKSQGYSDEDTFLTEPLNDAAPNVVKFSKNDIEKILENASKADSTFKKAFDTYLSLLQLTAFCVRDDGCLPLTVERLQAAYSSDERRAIYDAVVSTVPSSQDLLDLTLPGNVDQKGERVKSKQEVLAELRDMKRRRTKYRVAAKTKNYSDVLRDVIKTQMEMYTETQTEVATKIKIEKEDYASETLHDQIKDNEYTQRSEHRHKEKYKKRDRDRSGDRSARDRKWQQYDAEPRRGSYSERLSHISHEDRKRHHSERDRDYNNSNRHTHKEREHKLSQDCNKYYERNRNEDSRIRHHESDYKRRHNLSSSSKHDGRKISEYKRYHD